MLPSIRRQWLNTLRRAIKQKVHRKYHRENRSFRKEKSSIFWSRGDTNLSIGCIFPRQLMQRLKTWIPSSEISSWSAVDTCHMPGCLMAKGGSSPQCNAPEFYFTIVESSGNVCNILCMHSSFIYFFQGCYLLSGKCAVFEKRLHFKFCSYNIQNFKILI